MRDPGPIQETPHAILVVDQLEQFSEGVEDLEAVVRLFLLNRHSVILNSRVSPAELVNITDGLRAIAADGQIIEIGHPSIETQFELARRRVRAESQAEIANQRKEIERLHAVIEKASSKPAGTAVETGLRRRLAAKEEQIRELENRLAEADQRAARRLPRRRFHTGGSRWVSPAPVDLDERIQKAREEAWRRGRRSPRPCVSNSSRPWINSPPFARRNPGKRG